MDIKPEDRYAPEPMIYMPCVFVACCLIVRWRLNKIKCV